MAATYVTESDRGRVLHLLRIDKNFGECVMFLDASSSINDAKREDERNGFTDTGPAMAYAIEQARTYANYVGQHVTLDTMANFYSNDYRLFTENMDDNT